MGLLIELTVIIAVAWGFGRIAERFGQPPSIGQVLAGVALAPILLAVLPGSFSSFPSSDNAQVLDHMSDLAIFFLILFAGIELKPAEIAEASGKAFLVGAGGVVVPFALGVMLIWLFLPSGSEWLAHGLVCGLVLSVTAIPASIAILQQLGQLKTRLGVLLISAALFDDIIGLFVLALVLAVLGAGADFSMGLVAWLLVKVVLFFGATIALGVHVYPKLRIGLTAIDAASAEFSALMLVALIYGVIAEMLGLHWVMGVFMAGLFFEPEQVGAKAYQEVMLIVLVLISAVLGPLFFAMIGMKVELASLANAPLFLCFLVIAACGGKIIGAGGAALLSGSPPRDALALGVGMSARGAVELIILKIVYENGLLGKIGHPVADNLLALLVATVVISTMLVPPVLRRILNREECE